MNAATLTPARDIPRTPLDQALDIVQAELAATLSLLRTLEPADWSRPTPCTGWTVHDVVAHMIGQAEELARPDRLIQRIRRARRRPGSGILDRHNDCQVRDRAGTPDSRLIADLERWTGKAAGAARRMPAPVRRRIRLSLIFPEAKRQPEDSFDYLVRVLIARDPWMHRLDIAAATGRAPVLGHHDRLIVEQVIRDLALAWTGPTVRLDLSGPAGGRWILGAQPPPVATISGDAADYMRLLSGRHTDHHPVAEGDHTAAAAFLAMRIEF
jgi:uncharacterized protein (TIGR03083 family)